MTYVQVYVVLQVLCMHMYTVYELDLLVDPTCAEKSHSLTMLSKPPVASMKKQPPSSDDMLASPGPRNS